jgi:FK506-binding protein 4/5
MKKVLISAPETEFTSPNDFAVCHVSYSIVNSNKVVVEEKDNVKVELSSDASITEGVEKALKSMKKGEQSIFWINDRYSELDGPVEMTVTLHEFTKGPESWTMKKEEKLQFAGKRKQVGNALFQSGKFRRAMSVYELGVNLMKNEKDMEQAEKDILVSLYSNMAAVSLKQKETSEAKKNCTKALDIESKNVKVLYRRAQVSVYCHYPVLSCNFVIHF